MFDSTTDTLRRRLRPEARPLLFERLDQAQQSAFQRIIDLLIETIAALESNVHRKNVQSGLGFSDEFEWLQPDRSSRLAFLSGSRGTGKSTVLLSMANELRHSKEGTMEPTYVPREHLRYVADNLVWLEHLDMETVPEQANLLAAILARIERAASDFGSTVSGDSISGHLGARFLERGPSYHEALLQLQQLQTDVALAWEGNLPARAQELDPDVFALEVMRAERARLSFNRRLSDTLDNIARCASDRRFGPNTVFLLSVDDFDIRPAMCLPLLRFLRMISVPRLFVLVLGDISIADTVLNLKISNEIGGIYQAGQQDSDKVSFLSVSPDRPKDVAAEVASQALRKLIPPGQRIWLAPLQPHESLEFNPFREEQHGATIGYFLEGLKFNSEILGKVPRKDPDESPSRDQSQSHEEKVPEAPGERPAPGQSPSHEKQVPYVAGQPIQNMKEFIFVDRFSILENSKQKAENVEQQVDVDKADRKIPKRFAYQGVDFLNCPVRRVTDLWFELQELVESQQEAGREGRSSESIMFPPVLDFFARYCLSSLREDGTPGDAGGSLASYGMGVSPLSASSSHTLFRLQWINSADVHFAADEAKVFWVVGPNNTPAEPLEGTEQKTSKWMWQMEEEGRKAEQQKLIDWQIKEVGNKVKGTNRAITYEIERQLRLRRHVGWSLKDENGRGLSSAAAAALMLWHDLQVLEGSQRDFVESTFSPSKLFREDQPWAVVEWRQGMGKPIEVPWPLPAWESFWEFDLFLQAWDEAVSTIALGNFGDVDAGKENPSRAAGATQMYMGNLVDNLAFCWVSAATAIVGGDNAIQLPENRRRHPFGELSWGDLVSSLEGLAEESLSTGKMRGERIREWIARVFLLTFPETGLSLNARMDIVNCAEEKSLVKKTWRAHKNFLHDIRYSWNRGMRPETKAWLDQNRVGISTSLGG